MKTLFKISFMTLLFGWLPFLWLSIYASWHREAGVPVMLSGLFLCFVGTICFLSLLQNKGFWMRQDILDKYIKAHEESIRQYNEAKEKLIKKVTET